MNTNKPCLTVVIPALNEEPAIGLTLGRVPRGLYKEIIVADNGSRDRTAEIATEMGCRVFKQFPPKGYGPAMDRAVRESNPDWWTREQQRQADAARDATARGDSARRAGAAAAAPQPCVPASTK